MSGELQKILGIIATLLAISGGLMKYVADQQAFRDHVTAICYQHLHLESLFLKYHPEETASLFYKGAPTCQ